MPVKTKQQKATKIPKLRFPKFSGVWHKKDIDELFLYGKNNSLSRENLNYNTGQIKNIHYGDIHTKLRSHFYIKKEIIPFINDDIVFSKEYLLKDGDIILADASEDYNDIGKVIELIDLQNEKIISGLHTIVLKHRTDLNWIGFFCFLFQSTSVRLNIMKISQGVKVLGLGKKYFSSLEIYIPKKSEQQKIAEFLSSVDEWTDNLRKQKESLEKYKKGIMQKIFSQKVRFKDKNGNNFPDWEEKKLKEILKERREYSTKGNGYEHISLTTNGVVAKSKRYHRDFLVGNDDTKKYKVTRKGDLCYNPANLKFGVIAVNNYGDGIFSPIYITFKMVDQDIKFIEYYLTRNAFINKARRYEQGTVYERMAVHPTDFLSVKMPFPSLSEQQKVAGFLNSVDQLINSVQQQITQAEQWKKGLMQRLFV